MQRHGKFITDLKVDMRYFPVSKPTQNPDGTYIEAAPSSESSFCLMLYIVTKVFLFSRFWSSSYHNSRVQKPGVK